MFLYLVSVFIVQMLDVELMYSVDFVRWFIRLYKLSVEVLLIVRRVYEYINISRSAKSQQP